MVTSFIDKIHKLPIRPLYFHIGIAILLMFVYLTFRCKALVLLHEIPFLTIISNLYTHILLFGASAFAFIVGFSTDVNYESNMLLINGKDALFVNTFFFSIKHLFVLFAIILITPATIWSKINFFLFGSISLLLFTMISIATMAISNCSLSLNCTVYSIFLIIRNLLFIPFIYLFWNKNPRLKNEICDWFAINDMVYKWIFVKAFVLFIILYSFSMLLNSNVLPISISSIANGIMSSVAYVLGILGYHVDVVGRILVGNGIKLKLAYSSIGLNHIYLFIAFIVLLPGKWYHKLWFIPFGIFMLLAVNVFRIIMTYVSMVHHHGIYSIPIDKLNLFTYLAIFIIFSLMLFWITFFYKKRMSNG